jgi:hypothetical protein
MRKRLASGLKWHYAADIGSREEKASSGFMINMMSKRNAS